MKQNIKSRKTKAYKKRKTNRNRNQKRGGCGCGMKNTPALYGGNGYTNSQPVGLVPYSYNNVPSTYPPSSNYNGGNNADLYKSGMGNSISGGSRYRKQKGNKRRTLRLKKGGMIHWSNQLGNTLDPFLATTGTPMQSLFYTPSNYVSPFAPMA
jgi:hypothetical protein